MAKIIASTDKDFKEKIGQLCLVAKAEMSDSVLASVTAILKEVAKNGDTALVELTNKFDRTNVTDISELKVSAEEIEEAFAKCPKDVIKALELAAGRIRLYHEKQMPNDLDYKDKAGVRLGNIWKPIANIGIYVPGGLASYPSSVLMNAVPAKVAGSQRITMVVPAPENKLNPSILVAAKIAGVDEIYKIGGAQAIFALAYGTKAIKKVDKIVGPGNAYVAAAKRLVYGTVGIDMIAGPSEILVIADNKNNPDWIAADLLSQAEHDEDARSILITDDQDFANRVVDAVERNLKALKRQDIARKSWENNGAVIIVRDLDDAVEITDEIAPEHLEIATDEPEELADKISNAGAIFLGRYTPEAIGDYIAGPSHVLPTAGTAKFSSGLSVFDFLKRVSLIACDEKSFAKIAPATALLAEEEGLGAHALSVNIRAGNSA